MKTVAKFIRANDHNMGLLNSLQLEIISQMELSLGYTYRHQQLRSRYHLVNAGLDRQGHDKSQTDNIFRGKCKLSRNDCHGGGFFV